MVDWVRFMGGFAAPLEIAEMGWFCCQCLDISDTLSSELYHLCLWSIHWCSYEYYPSTLQWELLFWILLLTLIQLVQKLSLFCQVALKCRKVGCKTKFWVLFRNGGDNWVAYYKNPNLKFSSVIFSMLCVTSCFTSFVFRKIVGFDHFCSRHCNFCMIFSHIFLCYALIQLLCSKFLVLITVAQCFVINRLSFWR